MIKYIDKSALKVRIHIPDNVDENTRRIRIGEIYNILSAKENELADITENA